MHTWLFVTAAIGNSYAGQPHWGGALGGSSRGDPDIGHPALTAAQVADRWPLGPQASIRIGRLDTMWGTSGRPGLHAGGQYRQGFSVKSPHQLGEIGQRGRSPLKLEYRHTSHNPQRAVEGVHTV